MVIKMNNINFEAIEKAWFKPKKDVLCELEDIIIIKLIREINEDDYRINADDIIELLDKIQELKRSVDNK